MGVCLTGICWYCHWGWPKCVADIYDRTLAALDDYSDPLLCGPARVVWSGCNFHSAEYYLKEFDNSDDKCNYTAEELTIVKQSLEELVKIPMKDRCIEPDDYEGEDPELYPPPEDVVMVRR